MGADQKTWRGIFKAGLWIFWVWVKVIVFVVGLIGTFFTLILSVGLVAPTSLENVVYDIIFARANGQPNGAHIPSYLSMVIFGFVVCYKFQWRPWKRLEDVMGDPFQGIAAAGFLGGVHELIWLVAYYTAYWPYLSWAIAPEVIRDVSFVGLCVLLIITFWKIPRRKIPLNLFKWPTVIYALFVLAWFFVPPLFGYPFLPITTINNPQFGTGLWQQTPWWGDPWVNLTEVAGWILISVSFMVAVWRYKKDEKLRV